MVECRGSRVIGRRSKVEGQKSRSRVKSRGSKVEVEGQKSRSRVKSRGSTDPRVENGKYYFFINTFLEHYIFVSANADILLSCAYRKFVSVLIANQRQRTDELT
jgi:hypothetical protein